jgi:hypothetical protein
VQVLGISNWSLRRFAQEYPIKVVKSEEWIPVRTLSVHHHLPNGQMGRSSSKPPLSPGRGGVEAAAVAIRTESPDSSSGMKVSSVLENTDQMYAQ